MCAPSLKASAYPRLEVHGRPSVQQQRRYVDVAVVSRDVERSEAALRGTRDTEKQWSQLKRERGGGRGISLLRHEQSMMGFFFVLFFARSKLTDAADRS